MKTACSRLGLVRPGPNKPWHFRLYLCLSLLFSLNYHLHAQNQSNTTSILAAPAKEKDALKFNLNEDGSRYFQVTFLNQTWLRYNQSNRGTAVMGNGANETFDIGLRRTRIQLFGQITPRAFLYFQFGQNNFNYAFNASNGNRKLAAFFHDAVCEYRITRNNALKVGGGLTITNGLSRFSQPSIGTIMTLDVPVFAQATVDQTDEFSRKLSIYARGQIWKFDYRFSLSDPFPIASAGSAPAKFGPVSTFAQTGHNKQYQAYVNYNFFDMEGHATPYMTGTYLGKKKVWNVGGGLIFQNNAQWHKKAAVTSAADTIQFTPMLLWAAESFLDLPLNKEKGDALSAYAGYFNYNFGPNYLRYNGIMNPATGFTPEGAKTALAANAYGNAFPMFGTGQMVYTQLGYLLPQKCLGEKGGQLMPYASYTYGRFERLSDQPMQVWDIGLNWLIKGHQAKVSLDYQNRSTFSLDAAGNISQGPRKGSLILQYQLFI
jgi:hypothetical protein